jgi:hypothetical protein
MRCLDERVQRVGRALGLRTATLGGVNGAVLTLLRRLGVELGLPFNPAGSEARPCRAGQLYRVAAATWS